MKIIYGLVLAVATQVAQVPAVAADPVASAGTYQPPQEPRATAVPASCRQFLVVPADAKTDRMAWQQRLSLAACEDAGAPISAVTAEPQLQPAVDALHRAAQPSIALLEDAIARAPNPIKIRASAELGMIYLNIMVRARSAIYAPPDLLTNAADMTTYLALHDALEPLLVTYQHQALAAFDQVATLAAREPNATTDAAVAPAVASAHAVRDALGRSSR